MLTPLHKNSKNYLIETEQLLCSRKLIPLNSRYVSHLVKDFRDNAVRSLCVNACLHASPENPLPVHQELAIEGTTPIDRVASFCSSFPKQNNLRKVLACFETAGDKVVGIPSEVSTAVVMWLK